MKTRKPKISLFDFLATGRFGAFTPRRDCTPEDVMAVFGRPHELDTPSNPAPVSPYTPGDPACFPLVVSYGEIEFHFESPGCLVTLFADRFCGRRHEPWGGSLVLTDAALLRALRPLEDFQRLARARGLVVLSVKPHAAPFAFLVTTAGGIEVGFEHDDPDAPNSRPVLRWFSWSPPRSGL